MQQKWNQNFDGELMPDIPQKFLNAGCDVYMVMQLRHDEKILDERFASMRELNRRGKTPDPEHYEVTYYADLPAMWQDVPNNEVLEELFQICKHQLGRRNLTPEQKKFLIGKQYHSEKSTRGGNHGNQYTQVANCQIDNLPPVENTTERIAKENNVSPSFVIRAEQFMKTVELMEKYCPGIQEEILSGKLKLSQREATIIRGTPTEALPTVVSTWREKKLNGKPNDSADTYENSELLSKVTERNFSTAATSKIQTADPLSENRPFISSGKRCTELQTIREPGEKMATVDSILEIDNTVSSTTNENQQDAVDTTLAA